MASLGKKFEEKFRQCWAETIPDSFCYRLNDQMSGYLGSSNISDFICYKQPDLFLIECKERKGNTFPIDFRQYDGLTQYADVEGVHAGVVLWMSDHDVVFWIPIKTFMQLKAEDKKSFNIKDKDKYECLELPSKKLRTFMNTDYSALIEYYKEK